MLLKTSRLSKYFPGVIALDNVSLSVRYGEIVAVIGENGAGKSTLMKILAGIYQPDAGVIEFDGESVTLASVKTATRSSITAWPISANGLAGRCLRWRNRLNAAGLAASQAR